jgi:lipid II:glycine glycyltransferase (peptidoglycan interpeptide bridge formation enzyme)
MEIKEVSEKQKVTFNKLALHPLQSWEWGEFREKSGNKVVRLGVYKNGKLTDVIQVIFSLIPHTSLEIGTVLKGPTPTREMLSTLKELGRKENAIFIKIEPAAPKTSLTSSKYIQFVKSVQSAGCTPGKRFFTPTTFWIDLTKSDEELLKSFLGKTRYNIKVAEKHDVEVIEDNSEKAFDRYLELTRETTVRQGFFAHTEKYHRLMWQFLNQQPTDDGQQPIAHLLTAKYKGEIITTWILFSWHDFIYYPYGASTETHKEVMANNLMMWEAIKFGKKLGLKTFDLWGREEGKGFTRFKEGYDPQVVEFLGSWDLITSPLYWPYRVAEYLRWSLIRLLTRPGLIKPKF